MERFLAGEKEGSWLGPEAIEYYRSLYPYRSPPRRITFAARGTASPPVSRLCMLIALVEFRDSEWVGA